MNAVGHLHLHPISTTTLVRWCARAIGVVLIVEWVCAAIAELFSPGFYVSPGMYYQGAALAMVFAGYAIGWRSERIGGWMAIAGTLAFFAVYVLMLGTVPPGMGAILFAVPGLLYLEAWRREHQGALVL